MAAICRLSPESQSATQRPAGKGDKGGVQGGGGGAIYGQRGQQMPPETTGDLHESILPPPLLQLVVSRFSLSDTYHHCLWVALTFTSQLCRLSVPYVLFLLPCY